MAHQHQSQLTLQAEVENTVREHLAAFARGDFDAWGAQLAPNVFFTAADPDEVFTDREAAIAEMHQDFDPAFQAGLQLNIQPQAIYIGLSSDGRVAWSATPLRYTVSFAGETTSFLLRHTDLLTKQDDQWSILVTHYSLALPEPTMLQALTTGRLPPPQRVGNGVEPGSTSLVEQFTHQLTDLSMAAISRDAYAFGPLPGEHVHEGPAVHALFTRWTTRWGTLRLRPDGIRAQLMIGGEVGWVGANVDVSLLYASQHVTLPLRALVVYRQEQEDWVIVQTHISVGIPDDVAE